MVYAESIDGASQVKKQVKRQTLAMVLCSLINEQASSDIDLPSDQ